MFKTKFILIFFILFSGIYNAQARTEKVDHIAVVQNLINQAYKLGYVDAAPLEMDVIEGKVIEAKAAKDKRKKKIFANLIEQIKVDLRIVKQRYEVNVLNKQLSIIQDDNLNAKKILDELQGQL
jgi:hypothetical protein